MSRAMTVLASAMLAAGVARAAEDGKAARPPSVRVTGEAVVSAKPDKAEVSIGVLARGETARAAAEEAARRLSSALAEIKKAAGPKAEVRTAGYNLYPIHGGQKGKIAAYHARHTLQIVLEDLDRLGPTLDAAVRDGANEVGQVEFGLKDRAAVEREALGRAAERARAKAESAAAALGAEVSRVTLLEEGGAEHMPPPRPLFRMAMMEASADAQTPVEPGSIEVRASVVLTAEIAPKR